MIYPRHYAAPPPVPADETDRASGTGTQPRTGYDAGIRHLNRLMDQIYTEDLDLADLNKAVDRQDFAEHWGISLKFLELLSVHWPLILAENGVIDAADRRNRLLKSLAAHWERHPPAHKTIAVGSTGSIPATAALLKTVANLPDGCIVLPGLDQIMDEKSWNALDDTHPQATKVASFEGT